MKKVKYIRPFPQITAKIIDEGQTVNIEVEEVKRIVLTENDLHFYQTQEQLKTIEFVAPKEVYDKLFHPYYNLREVTKSGKLKDSKLMLKCLD